MPARDHIGIAPLIFCRGRYLCSLAFTDLDVLNLGVPDELDETIEQVELFLVDFFHTSEDDSTSFDWMSFKDALDNRKGNDMTIDQSTETSINCGGTSPGEMSQKVEDVLSNMLPQSTDLREILQKVEDKVIDLKEEGAHGLGKNGTSADFSKHHYVFFVLPSPGPADSFYMMFVTLTYVERSSGAYIRIYTHYGLNHHSLTLNVNEQRSWLGILSTTCSNLSAKIQSTRLVVTKGFRHEDVPTVTYVRYPRHT